MRLRRQITPRSSGRSQQGVTQAAAIGRKPNQYNEIARVRQGGAEAGVVTAFSLQMLHFATSPRKKYAVLPGRGLRRVVSHVGSMVVGLYRYTCSIIQWFALVVKGVFV